MSRRVAGTHAVVNELAQALQADERFAAAIVFGSAARGTSRADSDIDIAWLPRDAIARDSLERDPLELLGTLGQASGRDVHLVELERADPGLRRAIFARGRVLFDRSGGSLDKLRARTAVEYLDGEYFRRLVDEGHRRRLERALD